MLTPLSPSLLVVLILSWARPGDLFTLSPLRQPARAKLSRRERLPVSSSRRSSTTTTDVDNSKPKSAATIALENLLAQQKADVRGTERLLAILESVEDGDDREDFEAEVDSETKSTAASLLSGFDYGFKSRSEGEATKLTPGLIIDGLGYGGPPPNLWTLGTRQFIRNWEAIKGEYRDEEEVALTEKQDKLQAKLEQLTLNSTEIWEREFSDGPIDAPLVIKVPYLLVCYLLDVVFEDRYVPSRFFLLETVARMPYFSYITCLHLYETLGFWRRSSEMKRIHFAEELNEFNHLLIMESLGGDQPWWVRFVAQHSAIVYYVVLCLLWAVSPSLSYRFSELLETHAVNTYGVFLDDNEELLKELPPSLAAIEYYTFGITDSFYGEFQTSALSSGDGIRKPGVNMQSLYDVFSAIQADEGDHVKTMQACLDPQVTLRSPSIERKVLTGLALVAAVSFFYATTSGELSSLMDTLDFAGDVAGPGDLAVDAAVAGAAFAKEVAAEDAGEASMVSMGLPVVGESVRRLFVQAAEVLARIIATLI